LGFAILLGDIVEHFGNIASADSDEDTVAEFGDDVLTDNPFTLSRGAITIAFDDNLEPPVADIGNAVALGVFKRLAEPDTLNGVAAKCAGFVDR
jgi:hypothetical protein